MRPLQAIAAIAAVVCDSHSYESCCVMLLERPGPGLEHQLHHCTLPWVGRPKMPTAKLQRWRLKNIDPEMSGLPCCQWEFQDPKIEVLYRVRPFLRGISWYIPLHSPHIGLMVGIPPI